MLLSFVIPAYNVSDKIELCLKSIGNIPLNKNDYEIIIIDDSSIDNTVEVAETFLQVHGFTYRLIRQKKAGQASARNTGIGVAKGKYIWMVDSDDQIIADHEIFEVLDSGQDFGLITFNYKEVWPSGLIVQQKFKNRETVTGSDFLSNSVGGSYLWNKIYRRSSICDIKFIEGSTHIEDMCFNVHALININSVLCLTSIGYKYYRYTKPKLKKEDLLREREKANVDSFNAYKSIYDLAHNVDENTQKILYKILRFEILAHLYSIFKDDKYPVLKKYIELYKNMGLYPCVKVNNFKADIFRLMINNIFLSRIMSNVLYFSRILF